MNSTAEAPSARERAEEWLGDAYDAATRAAVQDLLDNDPEGLEEAFHRNLAFGTGGLRGIMGVGSNRMNRYTVARSTQGFANYLRKAFGAGEHGVAIAYDCRHNSPEFAAEAADVLASNGFKVYVTEALRPTPLLSFAVRELGCKGGIVITASHNPPAYNGYKVYWEDGAQVTTPHDKNIVAEVEALSGMEGVKRGAAEDRVHALGSEMDEAYLKKVIANVIEPGPILAAHDLGIVYTPLHGTGVTLLPEALKRVGFTNVHVVEEQATPDGDFSTVESPNPEEAEALSMAIAQAKERGASLVLGTDPDTDRVGIACADREGEFHLLNGNDTGVLLTWYQLARRKERGSLPKNGFVARTIVTTPLLSEIAERFDVQCYETLTGFKYIAEVIRDREPEERFITGGEESYGYMIGDFVRDKDGVSAAAMICELAAWARTRKVFLTELLQQIHCDFGLYRESLISMKKEGIKGAEEISAMMERFRSATPTAIAGSSVVEIRDYRSGEAKKLTDGETYRLNQPESNVLQFLLEDGSLVTARPSGTEPKIKFYFSVRVETSDATYAEDYTKCEERLRALEKAFLDMK
jgi:phosphoglucomutase